MSTGFLVIPRGGAGCVIPQGAARVVIPQGAALSGSSLHALVMWIDPAKSGSRHSLAALARAG